MDRKTFIKACGALTLGAAPATAMLGGCASGRPSVAARIEGNTVTVPLAEFTARTFVLVRPEGMNRLICVYTKGPREYTALSTKCTHQGCEVRPNDEYLACPCHGSEYSTTGEVLHGPAEQPLKSYATTVENDRLVIHLE